MTTRAAGRGPATPALVRWVILLAVVTVVVPARARAADQTAADLTVSVAGPDTGVATIEITSADPGVRGRWTAQVAGGRRRTFNRLPPGRYLVRATTSAAGSAETTIVVGAREVVLLEVSDASAAAPRIDLVSSNRPGQGMEFAAAELGALPSGRSLWALLDTAAPFLITDRIDNGGLTTGDWARVGNRGASWTTTTFHVGDEEILGPSPRGTVPFYPDLGLMDSVVVFSGLADPLVGPPGPAIALVPKRPASVAETTIGGAFTAPRLVSRSSGIAPDIGRVNDWQDGYVRWDGPATRRVGAVVSASVSHLDARERDRPLRVSSNVASFMAHVVMSPSDRDEVRVLASAQHVRRPFDDGPQVPNAVVDERDRLWSGHVTWDRRGEGGSHRGLSFGLRRGAFTPDAGAAAGGTVDRAVHGPVPGAASKDVTRTISARMTFAPGTRRLAGRDHSLDLSVNLRRTDTSATLIGAPVIAELVAGVPARVWVTTVPVSASARHVTSAAFAAKDDIALSRRLSLTLGLRADLSSGEASGAASGITWKSVSPLAVVHWSPPVLTMSAGYRRYAPRLPASFLAFGDPGEPDVDVYRWHDANGDGLFDAGEGGVLVARAGRAPSVASIGSGLHPSHTDEFSLRAERRIGGLHVLRVTATVRREYDIVRSVNTGAPLAAYRTIRVPNEIDDPNRVGDGLLTVYDRLPETFGQDRYVLDNVTGEGARYRGLEIAWEMRSQRWYSMAGASAFESSGAGGNRGFRVDEADQGVIGELFENPNAQSVVDSRGFFDRAYVLKWSTVYRGPYDILGAVTARYQDGQPFARSVLVPGLAQGAEVVAADFSEATRFSFTGTIDVRLARTFTTARGRVTALLDIFNLSNLADEVEEDQVAGPGYRRSTAMQPTRTIRVGLQFVF